MKKAIQIIIQKRSVNSWIVTIIFLLNGKPVSCAQDEAKTEDEAFSMRNTVIAEHAVSTEMNKANGKFMAELSPMGAFRQTPNMLDLILSQICP